MGHLGQLRGKPWAAGRAHSWEAEFQGRGGARGWQRPSAAGDRQGLEAAAPTQGRGGGPPQPHAAGDRPVGLHPANTNRLRRCRSFWPEKADKNRAGTSIRKLTRWLLSATIHGCAEPQQLRLRRSYFRLSRQKPALPTRRAVTP